METLMEIYRADYEAYAECADDEGLQKMTLEEYVMEMEEARELYFHDEMEYRTAVGAY